MLKNMPDNDTYEQISELLDVYKTSESAYAKEKARTLIVAHMVPVVKNIAKTIARRAYDPIEDLVQAGFIGLLKAIERYNKDKNDNFRIYAGYLIIGEMKHYIRDKLHMIRVPSYIQELTIRINNFTRNLTPEEVSSLTTDEVASALDVSPKAVNLVMQAERRRTTISLEELNTGDDGGGSFEEFLPAENFKDKEKYEDVKIIFDDIIEKLPNEDKIFIDMFYKQDMSKKAIAKAMLISQTSVARKLRHAFDLMAELMAEKRQEIENFNNEEV